MMCRLLTILLLLLLPATLQAKTIQYVGSSTIGTFMKEAEKVYRKTTFTINTKPESGGGERAVTSGTCDLAGVARELKPSISAKGVRKHLIGYDAIGVWVNKENPVTGLSREQLSGIFSGKITNWQEVGGVDAPINIYIVNPQSATRKVFSSYLFRQSSYGGNYSTVRPDPAIIERVSEDPNGIGHLSFAIGDSHSQVAKVKKLTVENHKATVFNSKYPIRRPLYLVTPQKTKPYVEKFINWSLSSNGQEIVRKFFVGI